MSNALSRVIALSLLGAGLGYTATAHSVTGQVTDSTGTAGLEGAIVSVEDTEGPTLLVGNDGSGYLIVSAREADRFVIYDRQQPHATLGIVTVAASADKSIDAVTHTDGLDVTSAPLPGYPDGLMVVRDDGNPAKGEDQNFKLVSFEDVLSQSARSKTTRFLRLSSLIDGPKLVLVIDII